MTNPFARWRKRRAMIRKAKALEALAEDLEQSLLSDLTGGFGPWVGLAMAVGAIAADHKIPALRGIAEVVTAPRGRRERIEELRERAAALRKEARGDG
ncbi:MAG: hypothetical protein M0Z66_16030 [Thermaerobacter sp.]|nr:hypothetical protein [Thermaerobacter sp.]